MLLEAQSHQINVDNKFDYNFFKHNFCIKPYYVVNMYPGNPKGPDSRVIIGSMNNWT